MRDAVCQLMVCFVSSLTGCLCSYCSQYGDQLQRDNCLRAIWNYSLNIYFFDLAIGRICSLCSASAHSMPGLIKGAMVDEILLES